LKRDTTSEYPDALRANVSETYVCARCQAAVERSFEVRSIIKTCDECGENGRFLHEALVQSLSEIAAENRPDGWDQMTLDERFEAALKEGVITITRK
jgi:DNA-directed RNA polymerase subunit RPC12/RpoP